jgi:thermitase
MKRRGGEIGVEKKRSGGEKMKLRMGKVGGFLLFSFFWFLISGIALATPPPEYVEYQILAKLGPEQGPVELPEIHLDLVEGYNGHLFLLQQRNRRPGAFGLPIYLERRLKEDLGLLKAERLFGAWFLLSFSQKYATADLLEKLRNNYREFSAVEFNYILATQGIPNDPQFASQWALEKIQAPEAWDIHIGSKDMQVAVIDTGADLDHEDLAANINRGLSRDFIDGGNQPLDDVGHGSRIAGIIAAVGDNNKGISGVNQTADLVIYKAFAEKEPFRNLGLGSVDKIIRAIEAALKDGLEVLNISGGTKHDSLALKEAIEQTTEKDIIIVAAAGNTPDDKPLYPAAYEEVIGVVATDKNDRLAAFSNYASTNDIAAPGVDILSTLPGNNYGEGYGTSLASAFVAGACALLRSYQPGLTAEEIREIILENTDPVITDKPLFVGRLNLYKAILAAEEEEGGENQPPLAVLKAEPTQGTAPLTVEFSGEDSSDPDGEIEDYIWNLGDGTIVNRQSSFTHTYNQVGNYRVELTVKDDEGASATTATNIQVISSDKPRLNKATIKGKVRDAHTQAPLEGARVVALHRKMVMALHREGFMFMDHKGVLTDQEGNYELSLDWLGSSSAIYKIRASKFGRYGDEDGDKFDYYQSETKRVEVSDGETHTINFELKKWTSPILDKGVM